MRKVAVLFIMVLLAGCGPTSPAVAPSQEQEYKDNDYTISVTGSHPSGVIEFSGNYMVLASSGASSSRSVDGYTPSEYRLSGVIVSCTFQKMEKNGLLRVEIFKDGEVVNSSSTTAAYGMVSVATR